MHSGQTLPPFGGRMRLPTFTRFLETTSQPCRWHCPVFGMLSLLGRGYSQSVSASSATDAIDRSMEEVSIQSKFKYWIDAMMGLILVLLVIAQIGQFVYANYTQNRLIDETVINRETGYKNRAVNCIIVIDQGKPVPEVCDEREIKKYLRHP